MRMERPATSTTRRCWPPPPRCWPTRAAAPPPPRLLPRFGDGLPGVNAGLGRRLLRQPLEQQVDEGLGVLADDDAHRQVLQRWARSTSRPSGRPGPRRPARPHVHGVDRPGRGVPGSRCQHVVDPECPPGAAAPASASTDCPGRRRCGWVVNSQVSCTNWLAVSCTPGWPRHHSVPLARRTQGAVEVHGQPRGLRSATRVSSS
jgi:hypothetical protein